MSGLNRLGIVGFYALLISICCLVFGCRSFGPSHRSSKSIPWRSNGFPGLNTHGLILGDVESRKLAAQHILRAPIGWDCPGTLDNSGYCTPLESQGENPWCAAYSIGQLLSASYWREFHFRRDFQEDRIYAAARAIDGNKGDGTTLEAVIKAAESLDWGIGLYAHIEPCEEIFDVQDVLFGVHKYGLVLVGLSITDGWMFLNKDGSIGPGTKTIGGHAVLVSGYSRELNAIWGPNWWGRAFGKNGWWYMTIDQFSGQFRYGYAAKITWRPNR